MDTNLRLKNIISEIEQRIEWTEVNGESWPVAASGIAASLNLAIHALKQADELDAVIESEMFLKSLKRKSGK